MSWLAVSLSCLVAAQVPAAGAFDVRTLQASAPSVVVTLDTGALKGEPRQLAWAPSGDQLYLQTVEGKPPGEKLRHYTLAVADGAITAVDAPPAWAAEYWRVKQDRVAPGVPGLELAIDRRQETVKSGTGPAGVLDRQSNPSNVASAGPSAENLVNGAFGNQKADVWSLSLSGEEVTRWVNDPRPVPGMRFSWGAPGTGALVGVGENGRLVLFDAAKHRHTIDGVKDAFLPAWSSDGTRLAWLQKTGRKKFTVVTTAIGRK